MIFEKGIIFGCFDLFHIGHYNIIEAAMNRCDTLTIGVFSDEAIKQYKGQKPTIPLRYRLSLLRAVFPEAQIRVIATHQSGYANDQDIMFVSDEYKNQILVMTGPKFKGIVQFLPHTPGISSSKIKEIIINGEHYDW